MDRRFNRALAVSALSLSLFLAFIFIFLTTTTTTTTTTSSATSSSSQPRIAAIDHVHTIPEAPAYQMLYVKNTKPFFLDRDRELAIKTRKKRVSQRNKKRKRHNNGSAGRPFSVMLPKGRVPPSGSSPCHNAKPDAAVATFVYCDLSTTKP